MKGFAPKVEQTVGDDAKVETMIGVVHNENYFNSPPTPTPEELLEDGKRYLSSGAVDTARKLIYEAIAQGLQGGEICFYLVLALLSGRNLEQLSDHEEKRLRNVKTDLLIVGQGSPANEAALVVVDLVNLGAADSVEESGVFARLDQLDDQWRNPILRHLELVLVGQAKNALWRRSVDQAKDNRWKDDRTGRVWKFFEPEPEPPRLAVLRQPHIGTADWTRLLFSALVALTLWIALTELVRHDFPAEAFALFSIGVISAAACVFFSADRLSWEHIQHHPTMVGDYSAWLASKRFASTLNFYCMVYSSDKPDQEAWLDATTGLRRSVAHEFAVTYPDLSSQKIGAIYWLIRHRASQILKNGTSPGTAPIPVGRFPAWLAPLVALLSGAVASIAMLCMLLIALRVAPLVTVAAMPVLLLSGVLVYSLGLRLVVEERAYYHSKIRALREFRAAQDAYGRWVAKISDRPTEPEMAAWLDADRTIIVDRVLQHYKLEPRKIISQAILDSPGRPNPTGRSKARVTNGPWRYRDYLLVSFLLTTDGIRQVTTKLDFIKGTFTDESRENFRYDTICSFRVETSEGSGRMLKLRMLDGDSDQFMVVSADAGLSVNDNTDEVADISADAAGLNQTVHLLEGVAAEGKKWISDGYGKSLGSPKGDFSEKFSAPPPDHVPSDSSRTGARSR